MGNHSVTLTGHPLKWARIQTFKFFAINLWGNQIKLYLLYWIEILSLVIWKTKPNVLENLDCLHFVLRADNSWGFIERRVKREEAPKRLWEIMTQMLLCMMINLTMKQIVIMKSEKAYIYIDRYFVYLNYVRLFVRISSCMYERKNVYCIILL